MLSERLAYETSEETSPPSRYMALTMGADPTTFSLTRRCSTVELRQLIDVLGDTGEICTHVRVTLPRTVLQTAALLLGHCTHIWWAFPESNWASIG
jgi:hypothetical protein